MSAPDNRTDGNLVLAKCRGLAPIAAANPLVARGLADLPRARLPKVSPATTFDPQDALFFLVRGIRRKDYDDPIYDYDEAIRLDPKIAIAFIARGCAWLRKHHYDNAIMDFDEAIQLVPLHPHFHALRGMAWLGKREFDRGSKDLDESVRLNSKGELGLDNDLIADVLRTLTCREREIIKLRYALGGG